MLRRAGAFHFSVSLGGFRKENLPFVPLLHLIPMAPPSEHSRGKYEYDSCSYVQFGKSRSIDSTSS
jgi:hypothetical protein